MTFTARVINRRETHTTTTAISKHLSSCQVKPVKQALTYVTWPVTKDYKVIGYRQTDTSHAQSELSSEQPRGVAADSVLLTRQISSIKICNSIPYLNSHQRHSVPNLLSEPRDSIPSPLNYPNHSFTCLLNQPCHYVQCPLGSPDHSVHCFLCQPDHSVPSPVSDRCHSTVDFISHHHCTVKNYVPCPCCSVPCPVCHRHCGCLACDECPLHETKGSRLASSVVHWARSICGACFEVVGLNKKSKQQRGMSVKMFLGEKVFLSSSAAKPKVFTRVSKRRSHGLRYNGHFSELN